MQSVNHSSRLLGFAFLLQAVTSLVSGAVFLKPLLVADDINATMTKIADNPLLLRASIFGDVITAIGIVFLGAVLLVCLRQQHETFAFIAFGLYIFEAGLLAASRVAAFSLLRISETFVTSGQPAALQASATVTLETMNFGYTLHMLPFCVGGMLFYYLLYKANLVPRLMTLWGLVTIPPMLIGTLLVIAGNTAPTYLYIPYIPFEFVIGLWILVRGIKHHAALNQPQVAVTTIDMNKPSRLTGNI
ncbi:MAG: DUF4386 domain-containing protein [Anaerolineae bacterium]